MAGDVLDPPFDPDAAYERFLRGEIIPGDFITDGQAHAFGRIRTPVGVVIGATETGGHLHIPCWRVRMGNGEKTAIAKDDAIILGFGPPPGEREGETDAS
jgi:hypothetical protein